MTPPAGATDPTALTILPQIRVIVSVGAIVEFPDNSPLGGHSAAPPPLELLFGVTILSSLVTPPAPTLELPTVVPVYRHSCMGNPKTLNSRLKNPVVPSRTHVIFGSVPQNPSKLMCHGTLSAVALTVAPAAPLVPQGFAMSTLLIKPAREPLTLETTLCSEPVRVTLHLTTTPSGLVKFSSAKVCVNDVPLGFTLSDLLALAAPPVIATTNTAMSAVTTARLDLRILNLSHCRHHC